MSPNDLPNKGVLVQLFQIVLVAALGLALTAAGCSGTRQEPLSQDVLEQIRAADQAYADAWLTNDSEQVIATLTSDAVMIPSGMAALEGPAAIRQFWFPEDSPPTIVTEFTLVQDEVGGQGEMGFVRGEFSLGFEYDGSSYTGRGRYLSLMRQESDGSWRISRRMWSDVPRDVDD